MAIIQVVEKYLLSLKYLQKNPSIFILLNYLFQVKYKNLDIKVLQVQERWISKVLIHINPVVEETSEDEDKNDKDE